MKTNSNNQSSGGLKLNYKRTFIIGFAFFGILLLWQVYDSWAPTMLTELFKEAFNTTNERDVQYLVGIMMAIDNLAALIMLPIFGRLSDKTHTKLGKRMPYILVGTFCCAVALALESFELLADLLASTSFLYFSNEAIYACSFLVIEDI